MPQDEQQQEQPGGNLPPALKFMFIKFTQQGQYVVKRLIADPIDSTYDLSACGLDPASIDMGGCLGLVGKDWKTKFPHEQLQLLWPGIGASDSQPVLVAGKQTSVANPPPDVNARFEQLLRSTYMNNPKEDVLRRIRQQFANRLSAVKDVDDALSLYLTARDMVGTSTRRHMQTQHGLVLNGPMFPSGDMFPSLVTAFDSAGRPKVVKLIKSGVLPAGSSELPGGPEAAAVRAICMRASKPAGLAIVDAEVLTLTLTGDHAGTGHGPGTYAAVVMPRYTDSLVNLVQLPQHVLAVQGARLEEAVEYIHSLDLVHMDIKGANILVDAAGQWALADFGGVVPVDSPIREASQHFAPLPKLDGKLAKKEYDWHMLAVALAVELHPDTWRDQLLENDAQHGMYAPRRKLEAAIQSATCPALVELFGRILGKCSESPP